MQLTEQQVLALAPDPGSAANGKKLAQVSQWPTLGASARAVWGECQGSGKKPYQVRVDLGDFASKCSCPSFKFPCKHALGLLVIAAREPGQLATGAEPEWVTEWLDKRLDTAIKKEARATARAEAPVDEEAARKRADKRDARVRDGVAGLQVWLDDLVRSGLARLPAEGPAMWEQQAARLVDAQAPGLGTRLRALADLPGIGDDWPARLLAQLGKLSLAARAYERIDELPPALQHTVRQVIGATVREEDVLAHGDMVADRWHVIGRVVDGSDRVRVQRSWLIGTASGRPALLLQFAAGTQPFPASFPAGAAFDGELAFYPGAGMQRALLKGVAAPAPAPTAFPAALTVGQLLDQAATLTAANPWHERLGTVLAKAAPRFAGNAWQVVGADGAALPLAPREHWLWLALAGGHPHDVAVEWDGTAIRPLGLFIGGAYHVLEEA